MAIQTVRVDNQLIAYHEHGTGEPVLLLHPGFVADGMLPLLDRPALSGYWLVAPHRRGHGSSGPTQPPLGVADLAADVLGLLDALGIARAHLVGHSLGACVALEVARTHPERVGRLVLLEPPLGFALSEASLGAIMAAAADAMDRLAGGDHEGAVATWLNGAFGPGWQTPLDAALPGAVAQATHDAAAALTIEVPALQTWQFGPADLAAIRVQMLSVAHEDAWAGFMEVHQVLVAAGAASAIVPVRSHLLQLLDADGIAGVIAAFVGASVDRNLASGAGRAALS